jgi:mRNA deadenylase 3'-5' endonuclease subunit Ccr4
MVYSLILVAKEISKYKSDLVGVQEVSTEPADFSNLALQVGGFSNLRQ